MTALGAFGLLAVFIGVQLAILLIAQAHDPAWQARQAR